MIEKRRFEQELEKKLKTEYRIDPNNLFSKRIERIIKKKDGPEVYAKTQRFIEDYEKKVKN